MAPEIGQASNAVALQDVTRITDAPSFVIQKSPAVEVSNRLLGDVLARAKRDREISEFIAKIHRKALRYASRFLARAQICEDAVAAAYVKLQTGKTRERYFMRALKQVCLDIRKRERVEATIFESAEPARLRNGRVVTNPGEVQNDLDTLNSPLSEDQDPLEILCQRDDYNELETRVSAAKRHPRWRFLKRKIWAKPLLSLPELCAETESSIAF